MVKIKSVSFRFNAELYTSLTCDDVGGWKSTIRYENGQAVVEDTKIADSTPALVVECRTCKIYPIFSYFHDLSLLGNCFPVISFQLPLFRLFSDRERDNIRKTCRRCQGDLRKWPQAIVSN